MIWVFVNGLWRGSDAFGPRGPGELPIWMIAFHPQATPNLNLYQTVINSELRVFVPAKSSRIGNVQKR